MRDFASFSMILDKLGAECVKSLNVDFLSLKEFFDLFAHVPCGFFGESEREYPGGVDVFLFGHVRYLGGDGRGLACACACEDQLGAWV